jgi:hypothetical protein
MRSPRGFAGSAVLLLGVAVALAVAVTVGTGAELIVHLALGIGFLLIATAVADFRLPKPLTLIAGVGLGIFAVVFLLQAAADVFPEPTLRALAFDVLGQRLEKVLGYVFLAWCVLVVAFDSHGVTRAIGIVVLVLALSVEAYGLFAIASGDVPSGALKLLTLPVFAWLLLESGKPPAAAPRSD